MEEIINTYKSFIKDFEKKMITKYNLKENPFCKAGVLFDRKGFFEGYNYSYHGAGCRLEKDGIICEYDVTPFEGNEIEFSLWKFSEFIRTHPKYKNSIYNNEKIIEDELSKLIDKNILTWVNMEGRTFKIYQIS